MTHHEYARRLQWNAGERDALKVRLQAIIDAHEGAKCRTRSLAVSALQNLGAADYKHAAEFTHDLRCATAIDNHAACNNRAAAALYDRVLPPW